MPADAPRALGGHFLSGEGPSVFEQRDTPGSKPGLQSLVSAVSVILIGIASHSVASMKPVVIGAYVHQLGFAADKAGYLLTAEMVSSSIGTTLVAMLAGRTRGRGILVWALILSLIANLVSILVRSDLSALIVVRFMAGLGEGVGLGRLSIAIATFRQPDRVAGSYSVASAAFSALGALTVPAARPLLGTGAVFVLLIALVVPGFALIRHFPTSGQADPDSGQQRAAGSGAKLALAAGLILYYLAIGAYWPFVGIVGNAAGISYEATSRALGLAGVAMVIASCLAIVTGHTRHSGLVMTVLLLIGLASIIAPMIVRANVMLFTVSASMFAFSWYALFPFLLGLMSRLDPSGRMNGLLYVIAAGAFAAGPGVAGWLVGAAHRSKDIDHLQLLSLALFVGAVIILASFAVRQSRDEALSLGEIE